MKIRYFTKPEQLDFLNQKQLGQIQKVIDRYPFRCNSYYLSLIDWDDENDPIRRIIIPHKDELAEWGQRDPSCEEDYTVLPGVEHKYDSTILLIVNDVCEGICRYCFRKRVFTEDRKEHRLDIEATVRYIEEHPEITNVLLTGGDPLMLSTGRLAVVMEQLRKIDHIDILRIGSRVPVFNPYRIIDDVELLNLIEKCSLPTKKVYIMTHFMHPKELSDAAIEGISLMQKAGAIVNNQMPLIRGVNDDAEVMAEMLEKLAVCGVVPYYVFQCRPAMGNSAYTVGIERGYDIVEEAKANVSGLGKRVRFVMSHKTGKIEIAGKDDRNVYFKYHRAARNNDSSRFMVCKRNPNAYWLDDYAGVSNVRFMTG